jgi:predicted dehydrogenase
MNTVNNKNVWLVGAGGMAVDYANVLRSLGITPVVIGRGNASAEKFQAQTGLLAVSGGLRAYAGASGVEVPDAAIVAVGAEALSETTLDLLALGVKNILVEKPAGLSLAEISAIASATREHGARTFVAYNRRFYAAVREAQRMIDEDGGVQSFNFEFTEWAHQIEKLEKGTGVKETWFIGNSTHVVDLAFHLCGRPREITCYHGGKGALQWHPSGAIFVGAGVTDRDAYFSYQANWGAPGRWGLEVCTAKRRLIFRPMEALQVMAEGSVKIEPAQIDDSNDAQYKPGLLAQVACFMDGTGDAQLCSISEHQSNFLTYLKIAGYAP